jgi:outer membrane protein OmpA-like peptidoglycan-associated protein
MRKFLLFYLFSVSIIAHSQDFLGLQSSNYAGVTGAISNPANIADNRFFIDFTIIGANINADNNYLSLKRKSIRSLGDPDFKSNIKLLNNGKSKELALATRLVLPSLLISLNEKNAIALNVGFRNYININGLSQDLVDLFYSEFANSSLLNKRLVNNNLNIMQTSWVEYGLTYARVLKSDNEHFIKAGITPKLIQGLEAVYVHVRNLDYLISNKDTFSFFNSSLAYGYSDNLDGLGLTSGTLGKGYKFKPAYGFGLDIGGVYEWRPNYKSFKYDMDGKTNLSRKDKNKYKLKAGFSLNDIGKVKFRKGKYSNEVSANVNRFNVNKFSKVDDFASLDSTSRANFSVQSSPDVVILLPTAINLLVDYNIWKPFYINATANITNLQKKRESRIYEYSLFSIAPRFEHKWFGLTIPVSYNRLSAQRGKNLALGAMLRLGPLVIGTNDFSSYLSDYSYGASFYALLKVPIPYGHKRDRDKDGVSDKKDKCKSIPGVWEFKGCPDKDGDHIEDKEDKCPDIAGIKALNGCPDKDNDGIADGEDNCPDSAGTAEFKGCPDRDGDKIIDRLDLCPDVAGLAAHNGCPDKDLDGTPDKDDRCPDVYGTWQFKGCPDSDKDSIPDLDDACPDIAGPVKYNGCPDKDGDYVLDKDDGCPEVAGIIENKGCPWPDTDNDGVIDKEDSCVTVAGDVKFKGCPPPIKAAERKIIEKAFSSLEFATGKDIIKPKSLPSLNDLAKLLIKHETEWKLKLAGHTDNEGNAEANMLLSEKRSKAVKDYLIKKGVKEAEIIAEWFGQTKPIADNATAKGRQQNRRVEMKIEFLE